jgi:multidrug efflux pump subunit AcrA (membrane-fusion protein)
MASTHAAEESATVLTVIAEKSEGILRTLSLTGTVTARREARLSSRATGLVMEMRVDEGDMVKKGDVLMTLDTDLAGITLEGIRAETAPAEAARRRAAVLMAQKRRLGLFGDGREDSADPLSARKAHEKAVAAMLRAGHDYEHVRFILAAANEAAIAEWLDEAADAEGTDGSW